MYEESNSPPGSRRVSQREISTLSVLFGTLLFGLTTTAHAQELQWATSADGTSDTFGLSATIDDDGNSVITGNLRGTATFGAGEPNEIMLTSAGRLDVFLAKYAPDGGLLWATRAGGTGEDEGHGVATDADRNILVTGRFTGTSTFGSGEPNETSLTSAGSFDVFVAKYAPDGTLLWATHAASTGSDKGEGVATDVAGNSVVTGFFGGLATFGIGEPNETSLTSAGSFDVFVAKYAPDGALLWATRAGGTGSDLGGGIATDGDGNSVVTGRFAGTATFGTGEPNEADLTSAGSNDVFVAKYAPDGALLWATRAGGVDPDDGNDIATDASGNVLVTGRFGLGGGTATFGAGEPNETTLSSAGGGDLFVAKYVPNGTLLWATRAGGTSVTTGIGIATDVAGNTVVTGAFKSTTTFGAGEPDETTLSDAGGGDLFLARYAPEGTLLWATRAGGTGSDSGVGIATDAGGNTVVTGFFVGTATFGAGEPNETVLTGGLTVFVAKYAAGEAFSCDLTTTDYGAFGCSGTFQVASTSDLDAYVASDFGRDGGNNYRNLKIVGDMDAGAEPLDIESPCNVSFSSGVVLGGSSVRIRGRNGVVGDNGYQIDTAGDACVLSAEGNAGLGSTSVVDAQSLTVQAEKTAKVGQNATVMVSGALQVISIGDFSSSAATLKSGVEVTAGSILVRASRGAHLSQNTLISAMGEIVVESTGDASGSHAGIKKGAEVTGQSITITASRTAQLGQNTLVIANGDLAVTSTGAAGGSLATVKSKADVTVGGDASVTSGNKVNFGKNSTVHVTGNLNGDAQTAAKCTVTGSANIVAGSTSGNCF